MTPNNHDRRHTRPQTDPLADALGVEDIDLLRRALVNARERTTEVDGTTIPEVPEVRDAELILDTLSLPVSIGNRTIRDLSIARGDPQHGALMSDSHVSAYTVEYEGPACTECGTPIRRRVYRRTHNIAGHDRAECINGCEDDDHRWAEDWD